MVSSLPGIPTVSKSMPSTPQSPEKFRRYRNRLKARGLRQIQLWVPDTSRPGFVEEVRRQVMVVESGHEDREALDFAERAGIWEN